MKKNELKQGVAYFCSSRPRIWGMNTSYFRNAQSNREDRYYIIFDEAGNPETAYRNPSMVYASPCKNYGMKCEKHDNSDGQIRCFRTDFRLMDIQGEFYPMIKNSTDRYKAEKADDGRGYRLAQRQRRIAERKRNEVENPIREEFFKLLKQASNGYVSQYTELRNLDVQTMKTISEALKAYNREVASVA